MFSQAPVSKKRTLETNPYEELINSLPIHQRNNIVSELDTKAVENRAALLCTQLANNELVGANLDESRILFLAALRNLRDMKITIAQLASIHILDSAIRTLYTNPVSYLNYIFVEDNRVQRISNVNPIEPKNMPKSLRSLSYNAVSFPNEKTAVEDLPHRMQKPLLKRFFNFNRDEWDFFQDEMEKAPVSEQKFFVLNSPEFGCYSSTIATAQKILKCMQTLDWYAPHEDGLLLENIMLVPSFSMFQAALNAKAHALKRASSVELVPAYGYVEEERYAELKAAGKVSLALYMPEVASYLRYSTFEGNFRTTIDGHALETAFAGAIHDVYHAMRELSMTANVAKARTRLAAIAKNHPKNKTRFNERTIDKILMDGELIYSYPPEQDTMFDSEFRPLEAQKFGGIFYASILKRLLHDSLKRAFIEDMVVNEELWLNEFNLSKADLSKEDQEIYDEIKSKLARASNVADFSNAKAITQMGLLATNMSMTTASSSNSLPADKRLQN